MNTDGSFEPHPAFPHINSRPAPVAADDHPLRYATGPFFVGCLPHECRATIMGPLWTFDAAWMEAGGDYADGCSYAHLIGGSVADALIDDVKLPPVYVDAIYAVGLDGVRRLAGCQAEWVACLRWHTTHVTKEAWSSSRTLERLGAITDVEQHDIAAAYQAKHRQPFTHADATSVTDSRGRVAARAARRPGR